jgi:hypothetical protein
LLSGGYVQRREFIALANGAAAFPRAAAQQAANVSRVAATKLN